MITEQWHEKQEISHHTLSQHKQFCAKTTRFSGIPPRWKLIKPILSTKHTPRNPMPAPSSGFSLGSFPAPARKMRRMLYS
jgi:hypothetical protein